MRPEYNYVLHSFNGQIYSKLKDLITGDLHDVQHTCAFNSYPPRSLWREIRPWQLTTQKGYYSRIRCTLAQRYRSSTAGSTIHHYLWGDSSPCVVGNRSVFLRSKMKHIIIRISFCSRFLLTPKWELLSFRVHRQHHLLSIKLAFLATAEENTNAECSIHVHHNIRESRVTMELFKSLAFLFVFAVSISLQKCSGMKVVLIDCLHALWR